MRAKLLIVLFILQVLFGPAAAFSCTKSDNFDDIRRLVSGYLAERTPIIAISVSASTHSGRSVSIETTDLKVSNYFDGRYPTVSESTSGLIEYIRTTMARYPSSGINFVLSYDPTRLGYVLSANLVDPVPFCTLDKGR